MMDESRLTKEIQFLNNMREQIARRQKDLEQEYIDDNKIRDIGFEFEYQNDRWQITDLDVLHAITEGRIEVLYVCRRILRNGDPSQHTSVFYRYHFTTEGLIKPWSSQ